jgi:hypothetical protein
VKVRTSPDHIAETSTPVQLSPTERLDVVAKVISVALIELVPVKLPPKSILIVPVFGTPEVAVNTIV